MNTLRATPEQVAYCEQLIKETGEYNHSTRDTQKNEEFIGYLGEVVVCDALGKERPKSTADKGIDLYYNGVPIDVKTQICNVTPKNDYYVRVYRHQLEKATEETHFLFLLYNPQQELFYVAGITSKKAFINTAKLFIVGDCVANNYYINDAKEEQYNTKIFSLAKANIGGPTMNENNIDWDKFRSKFLTIEPGDTADVRLTRWRQEQKTFMDSDKARVALVFDVVKVDDKDFYDSPLEWSTTSASLAQEFRPIIEKAVKDGKNTLSVRMKRTSDKKYMVIDLSER